MSNCVPLPLQPLDSPRKFLGSNGPLILVSQPRRHQMGDFIHGPLYVGQLFGELEQLLRSSKGIPQAWEEMDKLSNEQLHLLIQRLPKYEQHS